MGANAVSAEILSFNRGVMPVRGQGDFDDLAMDHVDMGACECAWAKNLFEDTRQANTGIAGTSPATSDNAQDAH
jgi:hypothetical protein